MHFNPHFIYDSHFWYSISTIFLFVYITAQQIWELWREKENPGSHEGDPREKTKYDMHSVLLKMINSR